MTRSRTFLSISLLAVAFAFGQSGTGSSKDEPPLPVIDENACPFEGCHFGKWIVVHDDTIYSSWQEDRKSVASIHKGEIVTGLTGVHITLAPDHIRVNQPIPDLGAQPGDVILRYMYRGEGTADIWVKGQWKKEYDCSFVQEKDGTGCMGDNCAAKVISAGRKEWWAKVKTEKNISGWTLVRDQFNCIDALGGDPACDNLK